jgi:hypothetical protein
LGWEPDRFMYRAGPVPPGTSRTGPVPPVLRTLLEPLSAAAPNHRHFQTAAARGAASSRRPNPRLGVGIDPSHHPLHFPHLPAAVVARLAGKCRRTAPLHDPFPVLDRGKKKGNFAQSPLPLSLITRAPFSIPSLSLFSNKPYPFKPHYKTTPAQLQTGP